MTNFDYNLQITHLKSVINNQEQCLKDLLQVLNKQEKCIIELIETIKTRKNFNNIYEHEIELVPE